MEWVQKVEYNLRYGGPEEGGWWYSHEIPLWRIGIPLPERLAFALCRFLNRRAQAKREADKENYHYGYTSVLSHRDGPYISYTTSDGPRHSFYRPHYE